MLEGKEMEKVVKIKTLKWVDIEQREMLLKRWGEIQREGNSLWSFVVHTGQVHPTSIHSYLYTNRVIVCILCELL
jgi:hypothetical protein